MNKIPFFGIVAGIVGLILIFKKKQKYIVIGDSQTPYIANASKKYELLNAQPGVGSLWLGGVGVNWLTEALKKQKPQYNVGGVAVSIGTNGGFNVNDKIGNLFTELKRVFPLAKFYAVPGSWGWGGNRNLTTYNVLSYYQLFKPYAKVLQTPIGAQDPHANLPIYKTIAAELDNL